MATIIKRPSGNWKAIIRKAGWPLKAKTFRTKRDAEDWARRTEDEMVRGVHIVRAAAERLTLEEALKRYTSEVTPTKRPSSQEGELRRAAILARHLGKYSLAALNPEIVAHFRDMRLAGEDRKDENGKPIPRANNTVRLELALLGHLFTIAIKEWGIGLVVNPVMSIRRPAPGPARNRRLTEEEEKRLLEAVDQHSNPMLRWIVRIRDSDAAQATSRPPAPCRSSSRNQKHVAAHCAVECRGHSGIPRGTESSRASHRYRPDLLWRARERRQAPPLPVQSGMAEYQTRIEAGQRTLSRSPPRGRQPFR